MTALNGGCRSAEIPDPRTGETIRLLAMYPTHSPEQEQKFGQLTENVAMDAPVAPGRFFLVAISHGTGGSHLVYRKLAAHLARNGYVALLVEHPRNNRNNNELGGTATILANRPKHIRAAVDWAFNQFAGNLKSASIAVIGHSLGGYTALALAGGLATSLPNESPDGKANAIEIEADPRVKAIVLLAPATPWLSGPGALSKVHTPILMFTGERDAHTTSWHAQVVKQGLLNPSLLTHISVPNAGHYSFLSPYPAAMINPSFPPSQDPEGFDREAFHIQMNAEITRFLKQWLKPSDLPDEKADSQT
jgi:predicted dienelactone hydrolase